MKKKHVLSRIFGIFLAMLFTFLSVVPKYVITSENITAETASSLPLYAVLQDIEDVPPNPCPLNPGRN